MVEERLKEKIFVICGIWFTEEGRLEQVFFAELDLEEKKEMCGFTVRLLIAFTHWLKAYLMANFCNLYEGPTL